MRNLIDDLEDAIRARILNEMHDAGGDLAGETLANLLIDFGNWRSRFVPARPRSTHLSRELQANPKRAEHQDALDEIADRIELGEGLMPFLSRGIKTPYDAASVRKKMHQRKDRDLLLADWGIHHLHLSTRLEPDGFVRRIGDLLFAVFTDENAYLINIYAHGDWSLHDVVETLVRNWPDAGILREIHGVVGLSQHFSDEERLELRNAGIAQMLEIDGKVYAPPGQTTAGTAIEITIKANELMSELDRLRRLGDDLIRLLDEVAAGKSTAGTWEAMVYEDTCGFRNGDAFVPVRPLL